MKIAFISGVKFGHELLTDLLANNLPVSIVFSYEDSKREKYSDFCSFDNIAKKYKIKNIKVKNINDSKNVEILRTLKPDLILVMGWSQLLKADIIKIPKFGVIGSHPTELPKYRGRAPIPWSIIKGLKESALTFFYIEEGVDNGDIFAQNKFKITAEDDAASIYEKIINLGKRMLLENLPLVESGNIKKVKQDEDQFIEYWEKRTPDDGRIDWSKSAKEIHTLIRATTHPYPGAFSFFKNSKLKIWKANYLDIIGKQPGEIIDVNKEGVTVSTGKGVILIKKANLDNNSEIDAEKLFTKNDIGLVLK